MARKIVVTDRSPVLLRLIARLQQERYEVILCPFDAEVFKCIKNAQPDLIVMDLSDRGSLGLNIMSIIKTDATLSVTPIVLCTAPTPEVQQLLQQLAEMRLYVVHSPCNVEDYMARIEEALGGS